MTGGFQPRAEFSFCPPATNIYLGRAADWERASEHQLYQKKEYINVYIIYGQRESEHKWNKEKKRSLKIQTLKKLHCKPSCVLKDTGRYQLTVSYCAKGCAPRLMGNHPNAPGNSLAHPGVSPKARHTPGTGSSPKCTKPCCSLGLPSGR